MLGGLGLQAPTAHLPAWQVNALQLQKVFIYRDIVVLVSTIVAFEK